MQKQYKNYTNKELKAEYKEYYNIVHDPVCARSSTSDIRTLDALEQELNKRDILISLQPSFNQ